MLATFALGVLIFIDGLSSEKVRIFTSEVPDDRADLVDLRHLPALAPFTDDGCRDAQVAGQVDLLLAVFF